MPVPANVRTVPYDYFDDDGHRIPKDLHTGYGTTFEVIGHGVISHEKHEPFAVHESVLAAANALDLARELGEASGYIHYDETLIYTSPDSAFPADREGAKWNTEYPFRLEDGRMVARVAVRANDSTLVPLNWRDGLALLAARYGCVVVGTNTFIKYTTAYGEYWPIESDPDDLKGAAAVASFVDGLEPGYPRTVGVILALEVGSQLMSELLACARDVTAYLRALVGVDRDSPKAVQSWMRGGNFRLLTGLRESDWLEVKSQGYRLQKDHPAATRYEQKIELAQDVARFVNGGRDAVLVIGFSEKQVGSDTVIDIPKAQPLKYLDAQQYRAVIDEHVYPLVDGLEVTTIDAGDGNGFMTIFIPQQPPQNLPYLVSGEVVGTKIERTFVSIVRRRGEGSTPSHIAAIHAEMVAGRAFLRTGTMGTMGNA